MRLSTMAEEEDASRMRLVAYDPGSSENLRVVSSRMPELKDDEILIKVVAFGINRVDILQRLGHLESTGILGLEVSGIVEKVSDTKGKWNVGDKVMALLSGGGYAEYVAVHQDLVMPIPSKISFVQAAAIPENWITAYQLLHVIGKISSNELILIHAGGSGVGVAAIQLAKLAGARVIVTAGSTEKIERCLNLGAIAGYNYKLQTFSSEILKNISDDGVDFVLDCVGGNFWEQNLEVLKVDGRWVVYGLLSGGNVQGDFLTSLVFKRISMFGTTLKTRSLEYRSEIISNFTRVVLPMFDDDKLEIIIDSIFPLGKISNAHVRMEENKNFGKIVVVVRYVDIDHESFYDIE